MTSSAPVQTHVNNDDTFGAGPHAGHYPATVVSPALPRTNSVFFGNNSRPVCRAPNARMGIRFARSTNVTMAPIGRGAIMRYGILIGTITIFSAGPTFANGPLSPMDAVSRGRTAGQQQGPARLGARPAARQKYLHIPGITDRAPRLTASDRPHIQLPKGVRVNESAANTPRDAASALTPAPQKAATTSATPRPSQQSKQATSPAEKTSLVSRLLRAIFGD
jgi:hypothetical protein